MIKFFKKLKEKMDLKKLESSYEHLLIKSSIENLNFISNTKSILILKHSSRCIISKMIMKNFIIYYNSNPNKFYFIVVDVLNNKPLSNSISEEYKVIHQSPQVLIIKDKKCVYSESQNEINFNYIDQNF